MEARLRNDTRRAASVEKCDVRLDGNVPPHLQSRLVLETIKYLLYQREQIPMPYEHLKRRYVTQESESGCHKRPSLEHRKCLQTLAAIDEHFNHIDAALQMTRVSRLMLIFGSTAVSPREVYVLDLSHVNNDFIAEDANCRNGVRTLMRTLITNAALSEADSLKQTSAIVMLETHRDSGLDWFRPKTTFKMPTRGKHFQIQFMSKESHGCEKTQYRENSIWFQAPRPIKGFKLKTQEARGDLFL